MRDDDIRMSMYPNIMIRFLRKREKDGAGTDDVLEIRKIEEDRVRATYNDKNDHSTYVKSLTYDQLHDYLFNVLWTVSVDEAPFKSVQFNIPGYPCMLITVPTLKKNLDDIMDLLESVYVSWPLVA
jgi:hypothetical protein